MRPIARFAVILLYLFAPAARGDERMLNSGDLVIICGDSIACQRLYTVYLADYLLMCQPVPGLRVMSLSSSGETTWAFSGRMEHDVVRFHPNVIVTCYGMNDGGYVPVDKVIADSYHDGSRAVITGLKKAGIKKLLFGSPTCVDPTNYGPGADDYNQTLRQLRDIARKLAEEEHIGFADIHHDMFATMNKLKGRYGDEWVFGGRDGFHPYPAGHMVIAMSILKGLGCSGDIGTVTLDLASGSASASEGHKILACENGRIEVESKKYPFCFFGDHRHPDATSSIEEFTTFNQDLNRFRLVVTSAQAKRLKVTWGGISREYDAADLEKGVNLAADFRENPFCEPFKRVEKSIQNEQEFELWLVATLYRSIGKLKDLAPDEAPALERVVDAGTTKAFTLARQSAQAVTPVRHTITVEPIEAK
jgi:lysophospholipase L1-like esterase